MFRISIYSPYYYMIFNAYSNNTYFYFYFYYPYVLILYVMIF